ncbi:ComEC family competence protein [Flavihumibacter sp. R14]|nr:ComEC family competence protein [Flavihumibacter soli]
MRLLIPLIAGIGLGINWPEETDAFAIWIIPMMVALFLTFMVFYSRYSFYRNNWVLGIVAQLVVLSSGCMLTLQAAEKYGSMYFAKFPEKAIIVTVITEPQLSDAVLKFEARVDQSISKNKAIGVTGKLRVSTRIISGKPNQIRYGSRLMLLSNYRTVDPPFNPGEFNFKGYLEGKQIYYQTFSDIQHVEILSQDNGNQLMSAAMELRRGLVKKFYGYLDSDAAALASTLILGYRSSLSEDIIQAYSKTGTMHVLSVSGMHVGIVFIVLTFLFNPFHRFPHSRLLTALIIIVAIWCYSLVTGFSPAVCRAATMMTFIVFGKALNRNFNNYNLLAVSAFFLLIYNPFFLVDIGFQLSYLAVIGLLFLQPKIYKLISPSNKWLDHAWNYAALSIAAQLATFPISLFYFHQFPVYFLLSNLIVVLPVALIMYTGILFLFIPWPFLLNLIGAFLSALIESTNRMLFWIEALPFSSIGGIWLESYQYILIYLIIGTLIWAYLARRKSPFYISLLCSLLFASSITLDKVNGFRQGEVIFYSLRQRSAVAYISRREAYLISNVSNSDPAYSYSIKPALESRGVKKIISIDPDSSMANRAIRISSNYWQFGSYKVLRWDNRMKYLSFRNRIKTDALLISGNPSITIEQLVRAVNFSVLIVDGSNAFSRIKKWQEQATVLKIPIKILKRSPAYVVRVSSQN